jgi:hypothetical protein
MLDYLIGKGYDFIRLDELLQATVREAALTEAEWITINNSLERRVP